MTRQEYINQLRNELKGLPASEIEDIIRDQEELITDALAAGRTEDSILKSLGNPTELARSLKAEMKIDQAVDEKKLGRQMRGAFAAVGALLVLAPFNLIFVLGPFVALMGILFSGWVFATAVGGVTILLTGFFITQLLSLVTNFWLALSLFFGLAGGIGLSILGLLVMYYITKFVLKMTLSYLKWNVNFIRSRA